MILEINLHNEDDPEEDKARFYCDASCTYEDVSKAILAQIDLYVGKSPALQYILKNLEWTSARTIQASDGWRYSEVPPQNGDELFKGYMYKITNDAPF